MEGLGAENLWQNLDDDGQRWNQRIGGARWSLKDDCAKAELTGQDGVIGLEA